MQAKQTAVIVSLIVATLVILSGIYLMKPVIPEMPDVPTAREIASLIVIPVTPNITIPDFPDTKLSLRQTLKSQAIEVCDDEFDFDEIEDLYDDDDEVDYYKEYVDDREYYDIKLGIDNKDDREISVDRIFKVKVEPDIGDDYKEKVYVTCEVTSDNGELEADLDYSL